MDLQWKLPFGNVTQAGFWCGYASLFGFEQMIRPDETVGKNLFVFKQKTDCCRRAADFCRQQKAGIHRLSFGKRGAVLRACKKITRKSEKICAFLGNFSWLRVGNSRLCPPKETIDLAFNCKKPKNEIWVFFSENSRTLNGLVTFFYYFQKDGAVRWIHMILNKRTDERLKIAS